MRWGRPPPAARPRPAAAALRGWRETEQLTDGKGNVVVADYDLVPPNRLRYRTSAGNEAVIIGTTRYTRTGPGDWERDTPPHPLPRPSPRQSKQPPDEDSRACPRIAFCCSARPAAGGRADLRTARRPRHPPTQCTPAPPGRGA